MIHWATRTPVLAINGGERLTITQGLSNFGFVTAKKMGTAAATKLVDDGSCDGPWRHPGQRLGDGEARG